MRVVFPYVAQYHQIFHSLPIAAEMARRHPDVQVSAAGATGAHVEFVRELLARHAPDAPVQVDELKRPFFGHRPAKKRTMARNLDYLSSFDAIVTPERTSLFLKKGLGLGLPRLIWTRHGAGDRAIGFADDVDQFDYVLLAGPKIEERLLSSGLIRPGHYAAGVYAKFDWVPSEPARQQWFDNDRPTVLYNPHFDPGLSSWPDFGLSVLEQFAADARYNLIFAPHVRLFDPPNLRKYARFERFRTCPNVRIDLGSVHGIDMSYVESADLYLGDVSSQVAEFVSRPRPCLFLDAHRADWQDNPDYAFWSLGTVLRSPSDLLRQVGEALAGGGLAFRQAQERYAEETFGIARRGGGSGARGADAIVEFLREPAFAA
ncbi:MAG: sensor domain-containing protein [Panacagrimonas sp.]